MAVTAWMDWCSWARGWPFRDRRSAHLSRGPSRTMFVSCLGFQDSSRIVVYPPEVALLNKLVLENLRQRPVRTGLSVLAIGVEVTMILTLVGISYGTLDETARR